MPITPVLTLCAAALLALAALLIRTIRRPSAGRLVRCAAFLTALGAFAGGLTLLAWTYLPREFFSAPAPDLPAPAPTASDLDSGHRKAVLGTWTDNFRGTRTMTLREDGTGTMVVEPSGIGAVLFASRLQFNMEWSVRDGRLHKRTVSGEPADKVDLILKTMGDRVAEPIVELTADRLVLQDEDGVTTYTWSRVKAPAE